MNHVDAENPRDAWDCEPPLVTIGGRDFGDREYGIDIKQFTRDKVTTKNMYKIADVMGYSKEVIKKEMGYRSSKTAIEIIQDWMYDERTNTEDMEKVLNILKVPCYIWRSRGYSQGDVIDCLLVATDEWIKRVGIKKKDIQESLVSSASLFDAWAWGDVYGFQVYKTVPLYKEDGMLSDLEEEEEIESCWGYYGNDWIEQIFEEVKHHNITREEFDEAVENCK